VNEEKKKLREHYMAVRRSVAQSEAERLSARIAMNIFSLPRLLESNLIMLYCTMGTEVDSAPLIDLVISSGRGVALPYCRKDGSIGIGRIFTPRGEDLAIGAYGILEPVARLRDNVGTEQLGAIVCPGLAFDETCTRLGHGGGIYDRFLKQAKGNALIVGCAFDCQINGEPLPREEHDITMDVVVTETRAFPQGACPAIKETDSQDDEEGKISEDGGKGFDNKSVVI